MVKFIRPEDLSSFVKDVAERERIIQFILQKNNRGYASDSGFALVSNQDGVAIITELTCYNDMQELIERVRKDYKNEPQIILAENKIVEFRKHLPAARGSLVKNFFGQGIDGIKFSLPTS